MKIKILFILIITYLIGFEVNTHQALTRCAITNNCGNGYAQNLENFVAHGELKSQSYAKAMFENYGKTYQAYVQAPNLLLSCRGSLGQL